MVSIREMGQSDLDAVMAIEEVSFPTPWSRQLFIEEIGRSFSDALVAVSAECGEVLGYSVCWTVAEESHLLNIAVRPDARGRGVGRSLLRENIRRGAKAGAVLIHLEVRAGNRAALRLYARDGFSFRGIRRGYYTDTGEDAILLSRALGESDA
ncbi:MAG: ribosomal protein S18-alanine N-acetyltransferase [Deltaproteobacteria bacterium]|nr:ribosomal protein S18-alanine N-acetyltransferase [Deltaproteobacteria bacterium]